MQFSVNSHKNKRMRHILTILIFITCTKLFGADFKTDTLTLDSKILTENRSILILILTTAEFISTDSVTIIYMLDGEFSKSRFEKIANKENKQVIGIGIKNTDRNRDLLPVKHADRFLDFIEKELIPLIENNYLVQKRILYGHSFGGAFTIYSMITKPGLFVSTPVRPC